MSIFLPKHSADIWLLVSFIVGLVSVGYLLIRWASRYNKLIAWVMAAVMVFAIHWLTLNEYAGYRMLAIICTLFVAMKVVVAVTYYERRKPFSGIHWLAFSLGWIGMHPLIFEKKRRVQMAEGKKLLLFGLSRFVIGLALVISVALWADFAKSWHQLVGTLLTLIGISLALHFGLLNINAASWNFLGYSGYPVFRSPLKSTSLTEFWGKRWNLAFSEMAAIAVYKPLKKKWGMNLAKATAFLFSGILHELALSVPVQKGYGLPSLYFLLHALLIQAETKIKFKAPWLAHFWVISWLLIPMPLLFHFEFVQQVIWPILNFIAD